MSKISVRTKSEIFDWYSRQLAEVLGRPVGPIVAETRFRRLALDSMMAVHFILALEEWLGIELDVDMLVDYPTAGALADYLIERCEVKKSCR